jgi:hypothetical protein
VRRLTSLYPDVRCRILYQRDYLNLLIKYGLEEPSQGSSLEKLDGKLDLDLSAERRSFGSALAG